MKPNIPGQSRRVSWKSHLSQGLVKETHDKTEQYALLRWKENTMNTIERLLLIAVMTIIGYFIMKYGFPLIMQFIANLAR